VHPSAAPAGAAPIAPGRPAGLDALLAGRVLVELVEHGALLTAVVAGAGRRPVLRDLGDPAAVARELAGLRAALRRRARSAGAAGRDPLTAAAERCDRLLLAPLADLIGDRPLVVVPTGRLHAMPWGMLPTARGREVVVSPSAAIWCRAAADAAFGSPAPGVLLVAGPDLPEAATEVAALAAGYPGATTLTGSEAACAPVLAAITARVGATGLVHLAAHGRFRADNPMFSALLLADGPLTVLDLEGLGGVPDTVILSACDAGLSDVRPGDELMGLAVALTGLGARAVIAAVAPVPDAAVRDFMIDLHDRLRTGLPPAAALAAAARRRRDAGDPAAADAFVCLGAG
jgi:hypothetical protein